MRIIDRLKRAFSLAAWENYLDTAWMGQPADSGVPVSNHSALAYGAMYACVHIPAKDLATVPLQVFRRGRGDEREPARDHPLYSILHDAPNPAMTAMNLRETIHGHVRGWGNGYIHIVRNRAGNVVELWPLLPSRMGPGGIGPQVKGGQIVYEYEFESGQPRVIPSADVLHIPGFGFDGVKGYNPIELFRDSIGLGMAAQKHASKFFANGARPSLMIESPRKRDEEAEKKILHSFREALSGVENHYKVGMVWEEMKLKEFGFPPQVSQLLESREWQVIEICRMFDGFPPHKVADLKNAHYNNVEEGEIGYVVGHLRPDGVRWEQAIAQKLLTPKERKDFYAEHNFDGLLRGNIQARYAAYATAVQWGWMNRNEIRRRENLNPYQGGDEYLVPLNMVPASQLGQEPPAPPARAIRALLPNPEERSAKGGAARKRIGKRYEPLIREAVGRIVKREAEQVRKIARLNLRSADGFDQQIEALYAPGSEMRRYMRNRVAPPITSLSEQVFEIVSQEMGLEDDHAAQLAQFAQRYVENYAASHAISSQRQLRALVRQALEEGRDLYEVVDERVSEWEEKRAGKASMAETVSVVEATARLGYLLAGVTVLRWVANANACPICQEMDGRIMDIHRNFLNEGDTVTAGGAEPLTSPRSISHPPLHKGCDCQILPS